MGPISPIEVVRIKQEKYKLKKRPDSLASNNS